MADELQIIQNKAPDQNNSRNEVRLLIVSGRSGSGKTAALNVLEDLGFYCIDNLPLSLLPEVSEKLICESGVTQLALGVDVRSPQSDLSQFDAVFSALKQLNGCDSAKQVSVVVDVLYLSAHENALVARFNATRRRHPLIDRVDSLFQALQLEGKLLAPIAYHASIKIDTSGLNIHQLRQRIQEELGVNRLITVTVMSFGFKHGNPIDADYVFDVRILPNPHWHKELKVQTGLDAEVQQFFLQHDEVADMQQDIEQFLQKWLPTFALNNRHSVLVAIGCTGGKHRSVYLTEQIGHALREQLEGMQINIVHREQRHWDV